MSGLIVIAGLPGSGKSTLARALKREMGWLHLATDELRRELDSQRPKELPRYHPSWTQRVYDELLSRAEQALRHNRGVVVDGNFRREEQRIRALSIADRIEVPAMVLVCNASHGEAERRIAQRTGDASEADASVRRKLAAEWEPATSASADRTISLAEGPADVVLQQAHNALETLWP